ncbi:MAG: hypothetical protein HY815_32490, partial [Candidatus Riflebacteria bacterium]|nr:hypothetical protein [Candidatus Riflebacteria bacterium]
MTAMKGLTRLLPSTFGLPYALALGTLAALLVVAAFSHFWWLGGVTAELMTFHERWADGSIDLVARQLGAVLKDPKNVPAEQLAEALKGFGVLPDLAYVRVVDAAGQTVPGGEHGSQDSWKETRSSVSGLKTGRVMVSGSDRAVECTREVTGTPFRVVAAFRASQLDERVWALQQSHLVAVLLLVAAL